MLSILHKGIHISLDIDTTNFTGDVEADSNLAYIQGLKAGRVAALDALGKVCLADGVLANALAPIGFIVNDAAGYFMLNKPAIASKECAVTFSPCVVITDQIDTTQNFVPGQKLYAGTAAKLGLVTNQPGAGAVAIGIAKSSASSAQPQLTILVGAK